MENLVPIMTGVISLAMITILTLLVRWMIRMAERLLDGAGTNTQPSSDIPGLLSEAVNDAVKKSQDRERKRKPKLEDFSDDELAELMERAGKTEEETQP